MNGPSPVKAFQKIAASAAFLLLPMLGPAGCASTSEPEAPVIQDSLGRVELDRFFLRFRQDIQARQADSVVRGLSRESLRWLEDMRQAARTEPLSYLQEKPFFEILCILALRVERRQNPSFDDRAPGIIRKVILESDPLRRAFLKSELGEPVVRGKDGSIGLREAPQVPVFQFTRETGPWRFHIHRSLPLILLGAESLARTRKPTRLEQAIFLIEQVGGMRVLPEDLRR